MMKANSVGSGRNLRCSDSRSGPLPPGSVLLQSKMTLRGHVTWFGQTPSTDHPFPRRTLRQFE